VAISLDDRRLRRQASQPAQRWAKVPRSATEDSGLSDGEYRLLCFLIDHGNSQGWSRFPVEKMAAKLKVSESTVHRRLRKLEAKGLITREPRHNAWGVQLPNGITVLSRVSSVTPRKKRLRRVSPGKPRVSHLTPEVEPVTTETATSDKDVASLINRRERGNRRKPRTAPSDITTKDAQVARLGGRAPTREDDEPELSHWQKVEQYGLFYDLWEGDDLDEDETPVEPTIIDREPYPWVPDSWLEGVSIIRGRAWLDDLQSSLDG
jgi:DNA-binding transcriptional ArsR family regulator